MEKIKIYVEELINLCGLTGDWVPYVRHLVLVLVAVILSFLAGYICRKFIPLIHKLTARTSSRWDDALLNDRVLRSASRIVPAVVIWQLLPLVFYEFPTVREVLARLTAIYITVMMVRTGIVFIDSFKLLEGERRTATQQYLYSFCGVLKIVLVGIAVIVVISILINQSPATLLAGLGAASAVTMLVFQDTIKGLVAGIRLTSNDMLRKGDWITVPSAGANGTVEEISLTVVKVRNFDNTIVTVTPQVLVDGSFQNWKGMKEGPGRKQTRKIYYDFGSVQLVDEATKQQLIANGFATAEEAEGKVSNVTLFRNHIERWLATQPSVLSDMTILVRQAEATQAGMALEFVFWLKEKSGPDYEHATSLIMEYIYAASREFGLTIYQQFPKQ
ncbi:MAG: mechanosensitive ion channel [Prevotella sp.]|nr:mechanosensitive ion channel [Prevotella sp.]